VKFDPNKILKFGAVSGIALPVLFGIVLTVAISLNPWFSFYKNALSDLGSLKVPTRCVFNCGLILMGLFGILFSLATVGYFKSPALHIFTVAMAFLIAVGIFPEEYGRAHSIPAALFYILSLTGIFYAGILLKKRGELWFSTFSIAGSVVAFVLMVLTVGKTGLAIPEMIGAVFILSWIVTLSYKMLKGVKEIRTKARS